MHTSDALNELNQHRAHLLAQITNLSDFRPGSLVGRFRKCGKPNCHCAQPGSKGHGPSWSLTRSVKGKTVTKIIPKDAVETTHIHIAQYHQFQEIVHELVETNVKICDAQLAPSASESLDPGEAEKKG